MASEQQIAYVIKSPTGVLLWNTIHVSAAGCRKRLCNGTAVSWRGYYNLGFRVQKVGAYANHRPSTKTSAVQQAGGKTKASSVASGPRSRGTSHDSLGEKECG